MDPVTIGLIFAAVSVVIALVAWLFPRQPTPLAHQVPADAPRTATGIIVTIKNGFLVFGPRLSEPHLLVGAANPLPCPLQLTAVGLKIEGTKMNAVWPHPQSDRPLPCVLRETETISVWCPLRELATELAQSNIRGTRKIRAFFNDSYGGEHLSDWFDFDVDEWLEASV